MQTTLYKYRAQLLYIPLAVYWTAIFVFTSLPAAKSPSTGMGDKVEHFVAFFVLAVLLNLSLTSQGRFPFLRRHHRIFTIVIGFFYGALDEWHQIIIPGRDCNLYDWYSDAAGILLGLTFTGLFLAVDKKYFNKLTTFSHERA